MAISFRAMEGREVADFSSSQKIFFSDYSNLHSQSLNSSILGKAVL